MSNIILYILLLCILNSILFFSKNLGLNVILFMIPLIILIVHSLKINKRINNKKGLLFIIPILIISMTYFIYNNEFFKIINSIVLSILLIFLYIYTINPTYDLKQIINDVFSLIFKPFGCIKNVFNILKTKINNIFKLSSTIKNKIKSIIIITPIVIVILILLCSADMIFNNISNSVFNIFKYISIENLIYRIISISLLFIYLASVINYILFNYTSENKKTKKFNIDNYTIKLLLTILNIIYIIFDIIQIRSLIFHKVSSNINYAQYAREGFFQLMFISFINLIIILISKQTSNKDDNNYIKIMSLIMIILNLIIVLSSFIRMYMYESTYGYTLLRLLVYFSLITEIILLIPTVIYVIKPNINIIKSYIIIITTMYTTLSILPIDYIIAYNNINRYYKTNKIDLDYLENYNTDNIILLTDLYKNTNDEHIKISLEHYFNYINNNMNGFQEYNISKAYSIKIINDIQKKGKN